MFISMFYVNFFFKNDEVIYGNIAYIEDEVVDWELSSKSISQQSKVGKSTASVAQRNIGQVSPSVIGQQESPRIRRSSYVKPRKLRGTPKDTEISSFTSRACSLKKILTISRKCLRPNFQ